MYVQSGAAQALTTSVMLAAADVHQLPAGRPQQLMLLYSPESVD